MKSSGTKIIIKPRLATASSSKIRIPNLYTTEPLVLGGDIGLEFEEEDGVADGQDDENADQSMQLDDIKGDGLSESASGEVNDGDDGEEGEVEDDGDGATASKGRGRPRGRGRGTSTGTSTPRGRGRPRGAGRARGRGRGRGGPLTIRLPGRPDDDAQGDGEGTEGGKDGPPAVEEVEEKETPLGGGKPFRKIQGKVYVIENDEFTTEDDPKGDTKIDSNGNLLGGRRFKAATFILPNRHPERKYMLAIDAARTSGFRDSLYYFRRNLLAFKLNATQPEKDYLIEHGKLGSHLRTRSVTLITARSAYKLHGSKTIIDGKWVEDDYYEEKSLEEITARGLKAGDPVGELPDPSAHSSETAALAAATKAGLIAQNKADKGGASGIYRAGGPTTLFGGPGWGPYSDGPLNAVRKSLLNRDGLNEENWMFIAAQRTVESAEEWAKIRKEALKACGGIMVGGRSGKEMEESVGSEEPGDLSKESAEAIAGVSKKKRKVSNDTDDLPLGAYEPHGGIVHYRTDTQPTKSRWEVASDSKKKKVLGGTKTGNGAWALAWVDTVMELPSPDHVDLEDMERNKLMSSIEA